MTAPERIWLQDNGDFDAASEVSWCQHRIDDNDTEYVRADLATVPAQVRVKPLVWEGDGHWRSGDNEGWLEEANTPFGWGYAVEFGKLDTGPWKVSSTFGSDIVKFDTPSAAKAAAQADYEARIRAAIEPQPDHRTADYEQAYQYALTLADALMAKHYPDNKYWRPLGDLTGLLTQIDNMVAGKKPDPRDEVIARLVEAADVTLHDIDDLVANSAGVAGLHMNGDVAEWETLLDGGAFGSWLASVEKLRAALAAAKAVQHG